MFNNKDYEKKVVFALDREQTLGMHTRKKLTEHLRLGFESTLLAILGELALRVIVSII